MNDLSNLMAEPFDPCCSGCSLEFAADDLDEGFCDDCKCQTYCGVCTKNFGDEGFDYSKDEPVCLGCADDREHRQDSAFYTMEPGHEVVFQDEENPFFVVRNGEMRIHAMKNGHEVVIRYTDDLEDFGITNDKQLGEWSAKEELFDWVNNSWFEVWNDEDDDYYSDTYHTLDEAISAAISLKETFAKESNV